MKVLAFDIATKTGWAFGEKESESSGSFKFVNYFDYEQKCRELIRLYKPDIIICAEATRFYTAQRKMNMLCGAMRVSADRFGVKLYQVQRKGKRKSKGFPVDSEIKKLVFGKGKVSKQEICKRYNTKDEDEADAKMFVEYFYMISRIKCV